MGHPVRISLLPKLERVSARAAEAAEPQDSLVNAWLMRASWQKLSIFMGALICPVFVLLFRLGATKVGRRR